MQTDLGVPVWRRMNRSGPAPYAYSTIRQSSNPQMDLPGPSHGRDEPGIWHPTSPADLAAMRERIDTAIVRGMNVIWDDNGGFVYDATNSTDAVMAAIFGSSAT